MTDWSLTLDAPGASEALGRCYALLRCWAAEARQENAVDSDSLTSTGLSAGQEMCVSATPVTAYHESGTKDDPAPVEEPAA